MGLEYTTHEKAPALVAEWLSSQVWRYQTVESCASALAHRLKLEKVLPCDEFSIDLLRAKATMKRNGEIIAEIRKAQ